MLSTPFAPPGVVLCPPPVYDLDANYIYSRRLASRLGGLLDRSGSMGDRAPRRSVTRVIAGRVEANARSWIHDASIDAIAGAPVKSRQFSSKHGQVTAEMGGSSV